MPVSANMILKICGKMVLIVIIAFLLLFLIVLLIVQGSANQMKNFWTFKLIMLGFNGNPQVYFMPDIIEPIKKNIQYRT